MPDPKPEIRIYKSKAKFIWLMVSASPFIFIGLWMLRENPYALIAWLNLLFFGLAYPVSLYHLLDPRPQIILNEIGIFDRSAQADWINWELIEHAYLGSIHNQKFIALVLQPGFEPSLRQNSWRRWLAYWNKELGFQDLNIYVSTVDVDEAKLCSLINLLAHADRVARNPLLNAWEKPD